MATFTTHIVSTLTVPHYDDVNSPRRTLDHIQVASMQVDALALHYTCLENIYTFTSDWCRRATIPRKDISQCKRMSSVTDGSVAPETHESPAMEPQPLALLPLQPSHQTQHKDFPPQRSPSEAHLHGLVTRHDSALLRRRPIKICVLGSGSFATAMGTHLARQGHEIFLLTRRPDVAASIKSTHHNPSVFATYALPFNLTATTDASIALSGADYVLHAIPVQASFEYLAALADVIPPGLPIINTSKGLHTQRLQLMTELIPQALGRSQPVAVISGPTFAEEIMKGYPTGAVAASADPALAIAVAKLFSCHTFRIFTSSDVVGVEVAGALKNVYALCAGCLAGLGLGVNTTALLVTRACAEMSRLARELGSEVRTVSVACLRVCRWLGQCGVPSSLCLSQTPSSCETSRSCSIDRRSPYSHAGGYAGGAIRSGRPNADVLRQRVAKPLSWGAHRSRRGRC